MTFGAVLDANVLVPAALRDTLLRAAERGLYRPRRSDTILDELRRALVREGLTRDEGASRLIAAMRRAFRDAVVVNYSAGCSGDEHARLRLARSHRLGRHLIRFYSVILAKNATPSRWVTTRQSCICGR
jgi:predicted nucleic acid-binding protein